MQGSRLTAFELVHEKIPATLIADSAAAALMKDSKVSAVVVGADRVAANGMELAENIIHLLLYPYSVFVFYWYLQCKCRRHS